MVSPKVAAVPGWMLEPWWVYLRGVGATEEMQLLPEELLRQRVRAQIPEVLPPLCFQSPNSVSNGLTSAGVQVKWHLGHTAYRRQASELMIVVPQSVTCSISGASDRFTHSLYQNKGLLPLTKFRPLISYNYPPEPEGAAFLCASAMCVRLRPNPGSHQRSRAGTTNLASLGLLMPQAEGSSWKEHTLILSGRQEWHCHNYF